MQSIEVSWDVPHCLTSVMSGVTSFWRTFVSVPAATSQANVKGLIDRDIIYLFVNSVMWGQNILLYF